jgi:hypothetical protein
LEQPLVDAYASEVTVTLALLAAYRLEERRRPFIELERKPGVSEHRLVYPDRAFARRAESASEPLGDHARDSRGREERVDAQVGQPGQGARGIVGVKGGERVVAKM